MIVVLVCLRMGVSSCFGQTSSLNTFAIAYAQVHQPLFVPELSENDIPAVFSQNAFSIYFIYNKTGLVRLEWILLVDESNEAAWEQTAKENNWNAVAKDSIQFFARENSSVLTETSVLEFISAHSQTPTESATTGGLLPFWNTALQHIWENADASETLLTELFPESDGLPGEFSTYLQWWVEELSGASVSWQTDPHIGDGQTSVSLDAAPGTRLYRVIETRSSSDLSILDFVPINAGNVAFSQVNGTRMINYFNHLYKGTENILNDSTINAREQLSKLDTGIFDRWDGSCIKWTLDRSGPSFLMLGGYFLPTDLSDLFNMLSELDLEEFGITIRLDDDNTVVGLSRVRSLEIIWHPSNTDEPESTTYYLAIGNGFMVVAEEDLQMIDLIFRLNSRDKVKDSIRRLIDRNSELAVAFFENNKAKTSLEFSNSRMIFRQAGISNEINTGLVAVIKNFLF